MSRNLNNISTGNHLFCFFLFLKYYYLLPCRLITDCLEAEVTVRLSQKAPGDSAEAAEQHESQPYL